MANDDTDIEDGVEIHEPELPGVKTYEKDIDETDEETTTTTVEGVTFTEKKEPEKLDKSMHEPEAVVETQNANSEKRGSILTDSENVFDVSNAFKSENESGTILSDKRIRGSKFGKIITGAWNEWLDSTKKKLEKVEFLQEEEAPKVRRVEARKEVVKEAGRFSARAPRDDHAVVVEKLKTMQTDAEQVTGKPFIVKAKSEVARPEPRWTHTVQKKPKPEAVAPTITPPSDFKKKDEVEKPDFRQTAIAPRVEKHARGNIEDFHLPGQLEQKEEQRPEQGTEEKKPAPVSQKPAPHKPLQEAPPVHGVTLGSLPQAVPLHKTTPKETPAPPPEPALQKEAPAAEASRPKASFVTPQMLQSTRKREAPTPPSPLPKNEVASKPVSLSEAAKITPRPAPVSIPPPPLTPLHGDIPVSEGGHTAATAFPQSVPQRPFARPAPARQSGSGSRLLRIVLIGAIVLVCVGAGITAAIFIFKSTGGTPQTPVTQTTPASFMRSDAHVQLALGNNSSEFLTALKDAVDRAGGGVTAVNLVTGTAQETGSIPATAQDFFGLLSPHVGSSFVRAFEPEMALGSVNLGSNQPFLVLRSNSFDTVFAGMLEWEPYIDTDLAPLFGGAVTQSLDPRSGKVTNAEFVDATKENKSVRILYNEDGNERIVYGFVNQTTLVITASSDAFSAISSRL